MRVFVAFTLVVILGSSCHRNQEVTANNMMKTDYAQGFSVGYYTTHTQIDIFDPWDENNILQRYILVDRDYENTKKLPKGTIVRIPVETAVVYSSVHIGILEALGVENRVIGVCEGEFITSDYIKAKLETGEVKDIGLAKSPNIEELIMLNPEIIIASPLENANYGPVEKTKIPIVEAADWMENHPLSRAEWIKLYGILFGKEKIADSIFSNSSKKYNELKDLASNVENKPSLMLERMYGNTWDIPGNESYAAALYRDAGANHIFSDLEGRGSKPHSVEVILERAISADLWLLKYYDEGDSFSYAKLAAEKEVYKEFAPYKNKKIIGCNTAITDYYDVISLYPEIILEDLIHAFHPNLLPKYQEKYFFSLR